MFLGPGACCREPNQDLGAQPTLFLSNWSSLCTYVTSHLCFLMQRTLHPSFKSGDEPLEDIQWVLTSLRSHLWLWLFFVNHKALPVTSSLFSALCCFYREHENDKEGTEKSWKGTPAFIDASDTWSYKKENSFHKHNAGWCWRWMII